MAFDHDLSVTRDRWGIGHATAADADGAFFAQGWLAASDRLWQMEWDRRRALGTWAEVAGPSAVAEAVFFRRLDLAARSKADWATLDPRTRAMAESYSRGVNAWLGANMTNLPSEFDHHPAPPAPWEAWHSVLVYKVRHLFMGTLHRKLWRGAVTVAAGPEIARVMVGDPSQATAIVADPAPIDLLAQASDVLVTAAESLAAIPDVDGGSNSWALDGSRTASGRPLLAGDPHRAIEFPNVYYQCQIACPEFDVIGMAFPGVPGFPHFGHNASVAWCITHGMADDTDVFVETGAVEIERRETIDVLGADPVEVACASTERGPVVLGDPEGDGAVLSMMWTGIFGSDTTFDCLRPMLTARSVAELEESVRAWVIPVNSMLSADVHGDISFQLRGRVVERPVANRWTPVPGDDEHGWEGLAPTAFDDLHSWTNPERGFLVTANNRVGDGPPYISLDFANPARHDRIVSLLTTINDATVEDMKAIHADTLSLVAPSITARLGSAQPQTELGRAALDLVRAWNHRLDGDATGATVYAAARRLWSDEVGERLGIQDTTMGSPGWPSAVQASRMLFEAASGLLIGNGYQLVPGLETEEDLNALLGALMDRVASELADRFGPDPAGWRWELVHTMVSPHPLASARPELAHLHPVLDGCAGDGDTVRCGSVMPATGDRTATASVARYAFDLADWDRSGWVVPHGVSGVIGSGHDHDQRASWLGCELLPMAYSAEAIAAVAVSTESLDTRTTS